MIGINTYAGRLVAVLGLGRTGLASARALLAGGADVLVWDDDSDRREAGAGIGARVVAPDDIAWQGVAAVVLSPGVPLTHPNPHPVVGLAERLGAEVVGDVELFARAAPAGRVAAITGTNGKSTTTALLGHLLRDNGTPVQLGANLGTPILDLEPPREGDVTVLELSSYQIDLTSSLRPDVAVMLNISADHLDRHGGMDGYVAAKRRLFEMAPAEAVLVVGVDDAHAQTMARSLASSGREVIEISAMRALRNGVFAAGGRLRRASEGATVDIADLADIASLRGSHNWQNAAAASAAALVLGLDDGAIAAALPSFPGLAHRMEHVADLDGVAYINDSKATNADAAARALACFDTIYWIAGGLAKEGGIDSLTEFFPRIARAFLIGDAAAAFARTLSGQVPVEICGDLASAIAAAHRWAQGEAAESAVVLLSPACASFDQFASFEARGDAFRAHVHGLVAAANDAEPPRAAR